jgi:hypothetical protein
MKSITVYVASDGSRWNAQSDALVRDELDRQVKIIESLLPASPRHGERIFVGVAADQMKEQIVAFCRSLYPSESIFQHPAKEIHPFSYAGRFLSEVDGPLNRAWLTLACCRDGWMYSQPFFALHPDKFEGISLPSTKPTSTTPQNS